MKNELVDDVERRSSLVDLSLFMIPIGMVIIGIISRKFFGNPVFGIWVGYVVFPLLEYVIPLDDYNVPARLQKKYE